ncbi:MAG TPA: NUDIX domain-containing protein [Thermomicrobiales bacterium]|nr:NUDIX domain-containing protein [Thermomicrobiales bacterium]
MTESRPAAQNPDELFDLVDATGTPLGQTKRRADVHRDGDWHRAVHVWVFGTDDAGAFLLLQRRGMEKDTWPGKLDATAAGHLATGETPNDAFREIEEELGVAPDLTILRHVGTRISVSERPPHWLDRELQEVYLLRDDQPLGIYRPSPAEVDALVRVSLDAWTELLFGDRDDMSAEALEAGSGATATITTDREDPIPSIDGYFRRIAIACQRALAGERYVVV